MDVLKNFQESLFQRLLGDAAEPYQWQREAFAQLVQGVVPQAIHAPTSAGKALIIPTYLAALATQCQMDTRQPLPRRLVFVVNRRVLVDDATRLAETLRTIIYQDEIPGLRQALADLSATGQPLQIATLRGQFVDDGQWATDPTTPAIILATPDMLGSRLLFRGYGVGRNRAALHAGLLSMDTTVVHDEAHLSPAFTHLLRQIERRVACPAQEMGVPALRVIEMTATSRIDTSRSEGQGAEIVCDPQADPALLKRMQARKALKIERCETRKAFEARVVELVQAYAPQNKAMGIFVTSPEMANRLSKALTQRGKVDGKAVGPAIARNRVVVLTGTMRGAERDDLLQSEAWQRVSAGRSEQDEQGSAVLIATSAGEIGIDLDVDVLICDAATIERLTQRFGRCNRRGLCLAHIHLMRCDEGKVRSAVAKALALLDHLPTPFEETEVRDASPAALTQLRQHPEYAMACEAPVLDRDLEDGIIDLFAATTEALPSLQVPDPALWIHGLVEETPEIELVWRILPGRDQDEWLTRWPLQQSERLRLPLNQATRVYLQTLLARRTEPDGAEVVTLQPEGSLIAVRDVKQIQPNQTILIDRRLGGLSLHGLVDATLTEPVEDVSGRYHGRVEVLPLEFDDENEVWLTEQTISYLTLSAYLAEHYPEYQVVWLDADGAEGPTAWLSAPAREISDANEVPGRTARLLEDHQTLAGKAARRIASKLKLPNELGTAIECAARHHDDGKRRACWQHAIGNRDLSQPLGKSGHKDFDYQTNAGYRHELGSAAEWADLDSVTRHLIAAHHGYARPNFPVASQLHAGCEQAAATAQGDFDEVVRRYGQWGCAYLESLVKGADILAEWYANALVLDADLMDRVTDHSPVLTPDFPQSTVSLGFNPRNFGEYLAAIGLLRLLSFRQPQACLQWQAEGDMAVFSGITQGDVMTALACLQRTRIEIDEQRAMTLMSKNENEQNLPLYLVFAQDLAIPPLAINAFLSPLFDKPSKWKLFTAKVTLTKTLTELLTHCASTPLSHPSDVLSHQILRWRSDKAKTDRLRLDARTSWSARDVGWSPHDENMAAVRPWVEVLALLGIQQVFLPPWDRTQAYATWRRPRSIRQVGLAARAGLGDVLQQFSPRFVQSGKFTDSYESSIQTSRGARLCPAMFVI